MASSRFLISLLLLVYLCFMGVVRAADAVDQDEGVNDVQFGGRSLTQKQLQAKVSTKRPPPPKKKRPPPPKKKSPPPPKYIIDTFAGSDLGFYSGDGGPATAATLNYPNSLTIHPTTRDIYIADTNNHCIRRVSASTGIITTFAGKGARGFSGDSGPATSAQLRYPYGVAFHPTNGDAYIADSANNRIRRVSASTGIITTFAGNGTAGYGGDGGDATAARLKNPRGVVIHPTTGDVYIADNDNQRIRRVNSSTGIITTFAGKGTAGYSGDGGQATSASLKSPRSVAFHPTNGAAYIADFANNRIRRVSASTGIITTFAGNGAYGLSGDGGPATAAALRNPAGVTVHPTTGDVYLADYMNHCVRVINATTHIITTFAGTIYGGFVGDGGPATDAQLWNPTGVTVHPTTGDVYIADNGNQRIRRVTV